MNKLMERLNSRNREITDTLVLSFICYLAAIIAFVLAVILSINGAMNETKPLFMLLYMVVMVLSLLACYWLIRAYIDTIKSRMRSYRALVDVSMHHLETGNIIEDSVKEFEKSEKEHIPSIEE